MSHIPSGQDAPAGREGETDDLAAFVRRLGLEEDAVPLVRQALTHRSFAEGLPSPDNERLEFLGDSVLGMVVSDRLFADTPTATEGELTRSRASYVNRTSLATAARRLNLGPLLRLSAGEESSGGRDRDSSLADAFEALLAAVYLTGGLAATTEFVRRHLLSEAPARPAWDAKSRLQERLQASRRITPTYRTVAETGQPHERQYQVEVLAEGKVLGSGEGASKKSAEQLAAAEALASLPPGEE